MSKILDTNIIIRYLLNDDPKKVDRIENLFKSKEKLIVADVIVSEAVWVLSSYYKVPKKMIREWLSSFLILKNIKANKKLLLAALEFYGHSSIDWIDAYLVSFALEKKCKEIYSYDFDLDKIKLVSRKEP